MVSRQGLGSKCVCACCSASGTDAAGRRLRLGAIAGNKGEGPGRIHSSAARHCVL